VGGWLDCVALLPTAFHFVKHLVGVGSTKGSIDECCKRVIMKNCCIISLYFSSGLIVICISALFFWLCSINSRYSLIGLGNLVHLRCGLLGLITLEVCFHPVQAHVASACSFGK
jgi:hypothetical protein